MQLKGLSKNQFRIFNIENKIVQSGKQVENRTNLNNI